MVQQGNREAWTWTSARRSGEIHEHRWQHRRRVAVCHRWLGEAGMQRVPCGFCSNGEHPAVAASARVLSGAGVCMHMSTSFAELSQPSKESSSNTSIADRTKKHLVRWQSSYKVIHELSPPGVVSTCFYWNASTTYEYGYLHKSSRLHLCLLHITESRFWLVGG